MEDFLFSVIIPIYNSCDCLNRCIASIVNQSFQNYELLLIDDGSTDGSEIICDEYASKYDRINVFHKQNGGVGSARNLGLAKARGKFIIFIDSDDEVETDFLSVIQNYLNDDVDLIHYGWYYKDGKHISKNEVCNVPVCMSIKNICRKNIFHGFVWTYVFKNDIIKNHKLIFSTNLNYAEDWEFILKYYMHVTRIQLIDRCLYYQIRRENSATNRNLGEKYICDNFNMYSSVLRMSLHTPKYLKFFYIRRIKDINIWLVNNVLFNNRNLLIIYKNEYLNIGKVNRLLSYSFLFWTPIFLSKKNYYKICKIYYKLNRFQFIQFII